MKQNKYFVFESNCKHVQQTCSANMFSKYVQQTCSANMFSKHVQQTCSANMFSKHVQQIWSEYENYDNREVPRNLRCTLLF